MSSSRLFLIVLLVTVAIGPTVASAQTTIGIITPLSGLRASIGEDARAGAELAMKKVREGEGNCPVALQFEDSRGIPAEGIHGFEKLKASGVLMVVTQNSNVSLPISPLANAAGVVQLAISTTSDAYSTPDDLSFRTNGGTMYEATALADYLSGEAKRRGGCVAAITMEDEYPRSVHGNLVRELATRGVAVCAEESFAPGETDFRTLLAKVMARKPAALACLGYQTECGMLVKQLKQSTKEKISVVGITPLHNREFFAAAGPAGEGTAVTHIKVDAQSEAAEAFRLKNGREPTVFAANAYDSILLLAGALTACECRPDPECLKRALFSVKEFHGLSGSKGFDDRFGDMQDEYEILVARDGAFVRAD